MDLIHYLVEVRERLKKLMEDNPSLTITAISRSMDMPRETVHKFIIGAHIPNTKTIKRIDDWIKERS